MIQWLNIRILSPATVNKNKNYDVIHSDACFKLEFLTEWTDGSAEYQIFNKRIKNNHIISSKILLFVSRSNIKLLSYSPNFHNFPANFFHLQSKRRVTVVGAKIGGKTSITITECYLFFICWQK